MIEARAIGVDDGVDASLRAADRLVAAAQALTLALEDLPALALPPSSGAAIDQAQVRAIAVMYLASELEAAGIIPTADDLVRLARTGSLTADLTAAAPLLERFWKERNERATAPERQSFFGALFGGGEAGATGHPNPEFEDRLIDLCEALYKIDQQATNTSWGGVAQQTRVRRASEQLLDNVVRNSGGLTIFLAKEILGSVRESLAILNHPSVRAAFGARSVSEVIAAVDRRFRRAAPADFDLHTRRGQAGMVVLAWLGDAAPMLAANRQPLVAIDHPVIAAAADWLETSLTLTESQGTSASSSSPPPQPKADDTWAAIAG